MKAIVCQGDPVGGAPSRAAIIDYWKNQLADVGELTSIDYRNSFQAKELDEVAADYDVLIGVWIGDNMFTRSFFEKHPNLKYVCTLGHGFGNIDHEAAKEYGVTFTNTVYGDMTIAQYGMAMLLNICHHIDREASYYRGSLENHESLYQKKHVVTRQIELYEKTIGIIGLGSIGYWMARMAAGFGMKVIAYSRHRKEGEKYDFVEQISLDELLCRSDVISVNCPLTDETRNMIDAKAIDKMKDGVIIINTARGAIIDEAAMTAALKSGKIYAAGLDVVAGEPLSAPSDIFECENAEITAHIAWAPAEARYRTVRIAVDNLKNWLSGNPTSVI
ncbi:MAG: NAD(P)-binding domain-containing protein [Butyrivibrio sp.]|nr:NAD(P)-binding domain-containing protein [Muribaculum sp.]MCM1551244.1 NAD(P)-binding domain-containing protein [Butyrivibrio sp.]